MNLLITSNRAIRDIIIVQINEFCCILFFTACREAYTKSDEQYACHLGCQNQLPFAEQRQEQVTVTVRFRLSTTLLTDWNVNKLDTRWSPISQCLVAL